MSVEALPVGYRCNLGCTYCYQNPIRDAGNFGPELDLEAMKKAALQAAAPLSVFGGEALLTPLPVLEELFAFSVEHFAEYAKKNNTSAASIQTNGALLNDAHVALFKKYRVGVGFSIDGPGDLNLARWAGSLEKTNAATEKSHAALHRCLEEGIGPSLIVTLHTGNCRGGRLPQLLQWFRDLDRRGLNHARLHLLEVDDEQIREELVLTTAELLEVHLAIADLRLPRLRFDVFQDMERLLLADDGKTTCVWNACDPLSTAAVQGIGADGTLQNCGRTADAGVTWRKADTVGFERQLALYTTPQEVGGCEGCEYWLMCKGQCPGTAIDNDWRNRTEHCQTYKDLFGLVRTRLEGEGKPTLASPSRTTERLGLEQTLFDSWSQGCNLNLVTGLQGGPVPHGDKPHGDHHGDHGDSNGVAHGDSDLAQGSTHGDHTDTVNPIHADSPHGDGVGVGGGPGPAHGDKPHGDIPHGDSDSRDHGDDPHGDDGHGDDQHADGATDSPSVNPLRAARSRMTQLEVRQPRDETQTK